MANRNRNALNRAAYSAGLRHGVSIGIRAKAQHLTDVITAAPDEQIARRILAAFWREHRTKQREVESGSLDHDPKSAQVVLMTATASQALLDAPIFDDLPLYAAGLACRDAATPAPVWVGRLNQLEEATDGMVSRGVRVETGAAGEVRAFRDQHHIATLVADTAHVPPEALPLPAERMPLLWIAMGLGVVGLITMGLGALAVGGILLGTALLAWVGHRIMLLRRKTPRSWRTASIASIADASGSGAPYRGGGHAREQLVGAELMENLRAAGFAVAVRGGSLHATDASGSPVMIMGAAGAQVHLARLRLRYRDVATVVACVHAMTASAGPLTLKLKDQNITANSPDANHAWQAQHQRAMTEIAAMASAIKRSCATAIKAL